MESGIQSSFIPHDAGEPQKIRHSSGGGIGDLLLILGIVAFAASCALAGAVFLYQQYLQSTSAFDLAQLQRARAQFEPALVLQLTKLDDRMHASETILDAHIAPSTFFDVLDKVTLKTVSFATLHFESSDPKHITVKMQGVAQSVNSIALQADLLSRSSVFTSPIFSNIDRQKDGVHFNMTALVNPSSVNFVQLTGGATSNAAAAAAAQVQPQTAAPAASSSPFGGAPASTSTAPQQ